MTIPVSAPGTVSAIIFDMNGTLRFRQRHEATEQSAFSRLRQLLGKPDAGEEYWEELTRRQKAYSHWAQENLVQLSEPEIWEKWILPEIPPGKMEAIAAELTLAWMERKGRTVPKPGAQETLIELRRRGYRLGLISNTMSTLDIPRFLQAQGWSGYFEVVILSSFIKHRKPASEPFQQAARQLGLEPACCAYIGNRASRDLIGCKRAGFSLGIILDPPGGPRPDEPPQSIAPDSVIQALPQLLDIFK